MKIITLWQPWASMTIEGYKSCETRLHDRFKNLKGQTIGIHAAQKYDSNCVRMTTLAGAVFTDNEELGKNTVPRGVILGTVKIYYANWLTENYEYIMARLDRNKIDNAPRFGLFVENFHKFKTPIPAVGKQGIWNFDDRKIEAAK